MELITTINLFSIRIKMVSNLPLVAGQMMKIKIQIYHLVIYVFLQIVHMMRTTQILQQDIQSKNNTVN